MLSTTLRTGFRVGLYFCVAAIAVLAFYPLEDVPLTGYDKINHVIAFAVLAWLAHGAYPGAARLMAKWALLLLAYGLFIEVVQHHLPYRDFSWLDLVADALGILLYIAGVGLVRSMRRATNVAAPSTH